MAHRSPGRMILKQVTDQSLHFTWSFLTTWAPIADAHYAPIAVISAAWIVYRERDQWPPHVDWDPWLDWAFFALGAGVGVWAGIAELRWWEPWLDWLIGAGYLLLARLN